MKGFKIVVFVAVFMLIATAMTFAMNLNKDTLEGNGNSTNQTLSLDYKYPDTRVVFEANSGASNTVDVYYQLISTGDWISAGSATINGTVNESNLVVDIDSEGVSDLKFVGSDNFNATILQFESGTFKKHW